MSIIQLMLRLQIMILILVYYKLRNKKVTYVLTIQLKEQNIDYQMINQFNFAQNVQLLW